MGSEYPSSDFEIEKYKLDRLHELELNKFTHALEMERLKLLTFLNGGAAAAWLTFSRAAEITSNRWPAIALIVVPALFWLVGLASASVATQRALTCQRDYTKAYHQRRRADEWRTLRRTWDATQIKKTLPSSHEQKAGETEEEAYNRSADEAKESGQAAVRDVAFWTYASITAFVLGALLACVLFAAVPLSDAQPSPILLAADNGAAPPNP